MTQIITGNVCRNCKHSHDESPGGLTCRRYPPTALMIPGPQGGPLPCSLFPPIQPQHTCGEFKPKIALEN